MQMHLEEIEILQQDQADGWGDALKLTRGGREKLPGRGSEGEEGGRMIRQQLPLLMPWQS